MFIYIVSFIGFVVTSFIILAAIFDMFTDFSLTPSQRARGYHANYMTIRFGIFVALWVLTGWVIFG